MVDKLLKLLLLVSPIAFTSGIKPEKFEVMFFHFGVIALFMTSLLDIPKRDNIPITREIVLFLFLCITSTAIHSFQMFSIGTLLNLFLSCFALNLIYKYMGKPKQYYKYITIAAIINIIVYLLQRYYFNFLPFIPANGAINANGGILGTNSRLANYLAIITPTSFSYLWFLIPIVSILLHQIPAIGIFMMVLGVKLCHRIKTEGDITYKVIGGLAFLSAMVFFWCYGKYIHQELNVRLFFIWQPMISEICKAPLIGHGLGSYYAQVGTDPFNTYLAFTYDVGILGLTLIGYTLYRIRKYFDLSIASLSLIAVLSVSMIDYAIEIPRLWLTIIFIIAAFFIKQEETKNASN